MKVHWALCFFVFISFAFSVVKKKKIEEGRRSYIKLEVYAFSWCFLIIISLWALWLKKGS